jgi:flagellar hook-length control protein FliK
MANSSIALLTQSLAPAPGKAGRDTSTSNRVDSVNGSQTTEFDDYEYQTADNQFSQVFDQVTTAPVVLDLGLASDPFMSMTNSGLVMPQPTESAAYQLLQSGGKELPFFGNFLPNVMIGEEPTHTSSNESGTAVSRGLLSLNSESTDQSVASLSKKDSIEEDIAYWLDDPELTFVNPSINSAKSAAGQLSAMDTIFPAQTSSASPQNALEVGVRQDNSVTVLAKTLSEFSVAAQADSPDPDTAATMAGDKNPDPLKLASNQAKQVEVTRSPLFEQMKLENRQAAVAWDTRFSQRGLSSGNGLVGFDSNIGGGENFDGAAIKGSPFIAAADANGSNSLDSFVSVLLNIDTSSQSSSSITPALDHWKAVQASKAVEQERTDLMSRTAFAKVTVPFGHSGWGENLGKQLAVLMARNLDSAQIQIDPPELGPLIVKIQVNNDQVSLHFTTGHGMVKEALEASSLRLQEMFQEQGLELASLNVSDEKTGQQQSKDPNSQESAFAKNNRGSVSDAQLEQSGGLLTLSTLLPLDDGKIDYFI